MQAYPLSPFTDVWVCSSQNSLVWFLVLGVPKGILLTASTQLHQYQSCIWFGRLSDRILWHCAGSYLAYKVRHVDDQFNETHHIFVGVYNILTASVVGACPCRCPCPPRQQAFVVGCSCSPGGWLCAPCLCACVLQR